MLRLRGENGQKCWKWEVGRGGVGADGSIGSVWVSFLGLAGLQVEGVGVGVGDLKLGEG